MFNMKKIEEAHLKEAAELFIKNYKQQRKRTLELPEKYEDVDKVLSLLKDTLQEKGVVVLKDEDLIGYMTGFTIPEFRGRRSIFIPEWAHSSEKNNKEIIYDMMYKKLATYWISDGCYTHLISTLGYDKKLRNLLSWSGFGMAAVDTIRDTSTIMSKDDIKIRRAEKDDITLLAEMTIKLVEYLNSSPIFLPKEDEDLEEYYKDFLSKESSDVFMALKDEKPISYMSISSDTGDSSQIVKDEDTAGINGAYTLKEYRHSGIGTSLLNRCIRWAEEQNYERIAVDFEPENIEARHFWLKYFKPVSYTMIRNVR